MVLACRQWFLACRQWPWGGRGSEEAIPVAERGRQRGGGQPRERGGHPSGQARRPSQWPSEAGSEVEDNPESEAVIPVAKRGGHPSGRGESNQVRLLGRQEYHGREG